MKYFSKYQLLTLVCLNTSNVEDYFNGFSFSKINGWGDNVNKYIDFQKKDNGFDKYFFNKIREKQPELFNLIDVFWEKAKKEKRIEYIFADIFADKINIEYFHDLIFNHIGNRKIYTEDRVNLIRNTIEENPSLFEKLHQKLLGVEDDLLIKIYINLLLKFHQNIQSENKDKEILLILSRKKNKFTENQSIKILNIMVKIFNNNQKNYDEIVLFFKENIKKYHDLRNKIQEYEKKIWEKFLIEEKKENVVELSKIYSINFNIKIDIFIDDYQINKDQAIIFINNFYQALSDYLISKYPKIIKNYITNSGMVISTNHYDSFLTIEKEIENMSIQLPNIFLNFKKEINKNNLSFDFFKKVMDSLKIKNELDEKLDSISMKKNMVKI